MIPISSVLWSANIFFSEPLWKPLVKIPWFGTKFLWEKKPFEEKEDLKHWIGRQLFVFQ